MIHHHSRPNVLVVLTDQQRADAVGFETPWVVTPNLDRLARESVRFPLCFVQSPQCQPSRASIFTGRYPTAHRVWWNETALPGTERTLGNYLRDAGYRTGYFGKLHFDGGPHTQVARHFGFDDSYLFEDWAMSFGGKSQKTLVEREFYGPMSTRTWTGVLSSREFHHEEIVTDRAAAFMREARAPFLCVVGYHGPHPPYAAPAEFGALYDRAKMTVPDKRPPNQNGHRMTDDEWRALKVQYYGSVSWIDDCLGRLLASAPPGTMVVYTSDHGDILGDHGLFSKGLYAYDGNTRVPLLIKFPFGPAGSYQHLTESIDILPTVLGECEVEIPTGVQGQDLRWAVRAGQPAHRYVLSMIGRSPKLRMVRTTGHKYWMCGNEEALFDLTEDPGETVNRSVRPRIQSGTSLAPAREELLFLLAQGLVRAEDPLPLPVR